MSQAKKETKKQNQNKTKTNENEKKDMLGSSNAMPIIKWPFYVDAYAKSLLSEKTDADFKREEELMNQFLDKDLRNNLFSSLYNREEAKKLYFSQDLVNLNYWVEEDEIVDAINKLFIQMLGTIDGKEIKRDIYNNTFQIISTLVLEEMFKRNEGDDLIIANQGSKNKNPEENHYLTSIINQVLSVIRQNINYTTKKPDGDPYLEIRSLQFVDFPTVKAAFRLHLKDLNIISYYLMIKTDNGNYYLVDSRYSRLTNYHLYKDEKRKENSDLYSLQQLKEEKPIININTEYLKYCLMEALMEMMNLYNDNTFEESQKSIFIRRFLSSLNNTMNDIYTNLNLEVLFDKTNNSYNSPYDRTCDDVEIDADLVVKLSRPERRGSNRLVESRYYLKFFNNGTLNNPASVMLTTDVNQLSFIPHIDENGEKRFLPDISQSESEGHFNLMKRIAKNKNPNKFLTPAKGRLYLLLDGSLSTVFTWNKMPEVLKTFYIDKCTMEFVNTYNFELDNTPEFFVENMLLDFNKYIFNNQF